MPAAHYEHVSVGRDLTHIGRDFIQVTENQSYHVGGLPNPYLGLASFTYADRARYAGREGAIAQAVAQLTAPGQERTLLFVTGASGSGKSSFTQAGLLPALEAFYGRRQQHARWAVVRPSSHPLDGMIDALKQLGLAAHRLTPEAILREPGRLAQFIRSTTPPSQVNVAVIDQFEELFTQSDVAQRDALFALLAALPPFPELRTHIIAALRADYLPELFNHKVLYDSAKQGIELRAMGEPELREAIRRPLRARLQEHGRPVDEKRFEEALVTRLARETAEDAAYLPLLQMTLEDLWAGGDLTLGAYDRPNADGSLGRAVRRRAEQIYGHTLGAAGRPQPRPPADQAVMLQIFLDLVEVSLDDDGRRDVRRRRTYEALRRDSSDRARLIEELCNVRLLVRTVERTEGGEVETNAVDIIHETLIRHWDRLGEMVAEQRRQLQQRARFEQAVGEWLGHDRADDYLLDGIRLAEARALEQRDDIALRRPQAQALLRRSVARQERQRQLRRAWTIAGALAVLLVMALAAAAVAGHQRRLAQLRTSESQRLAVAATSLHGEDPEVALLLASEAVAHKRNPVSEQALRDTLDRVPFVPTVLRGHTDAVLLARFSPDERYVLTASRDGTARLWDHTGKPVAAFEAQSAYPRVVHVAFSPDGERIVAAVKNNLAKVYDLHGNERTVLRGHPDAITSVAFSPDGRLVLTGSRDGTARLWDLHGTTLAILQGHQGPVVAVAFSLDGALVATGSNDRKGPLLTDESPDQPGGEVRLWDRTGERRQRFRTRTPVMTVAFSPDGRQLVVGTAGGSQLLSVAVAGEPKPLSRRVGVSSAVFNASGSLVVTGSLDSGAQLWAQDGQRIADLDHNASVNSVAFHPKGHLLVTAGSDGTTRMWDGRGSQRLILGGHLSAVLDASFSPDGTAIATGSADGTARLWTFQGPPLPSFEHGSQVGGALPTYSPDGQYVLTLTPERVMLWERDGRHVTSLEVDNKAEGFFVWMDFSPDGQHILTESSSDGDVNIRLKKLQTKSSAAEDRTTISLWDLRGNRLAHFQPRKADDVEPTLSPDVQRLLEKVFGKDIHAPPGIPSPDGKHRLVRSSDPDSSAQLLDSSGRPLVTFSGHAATILVLEFSADGQRVLTSSKDGTARLWNLKGRTLQTFNHGMEVYYAVISPDAQSVVTAGLNDSIPRLWRVRDASYTPLVGHTSPIRSVIFHPNGQPILTASSDGKARLWDLQGKTVAVLEGYHDVRGLDGATFSPDGRRVLTGAQDGARQYLVDAHDLLAVGAHRVGRCLTKDEIGRYAVPQSPRLLAPWPECRASIDHKG